MKRALTVFLAAVLVFSLTACNTAAPAGSVNSSSGASIGTASESGTGDSGSSQELLKVDMYSGGANYQGIQGGWFGKVIAEKFGIELNIIAPNVAGGGDTLYQTRSAAGNLGDIIFIDKVKFQDCVKAGLVMDITDLVDQYGENIKKYEAATSNLSTSLDMEGIYGIPTQTSTQSPLTPSAFGMDPDVGTYLRWDYYTELGSPELKTPEDLLNLLKQMQEKYPESDSGKKTYGFSLFGDWDGNSMATVNKFAWINGLGEGPGFTYVNSDATQSELITDDNGSYYNTLKMYFDANQMGLVDPDSSAQNYDSLLAKMKDGQVLFSWWPWLALANYNTPERKAEGKGFAYVPYGDSQLVVNGYNPYGQDGNVIAIGSQAKNPEKLIEFLDWCCSDEGLQMNLNGPEGLTWEMEGGRPVVTEYGQTAQADNAPVPDEFGGGTFTDGMSKMSAYIGFTRDISSYTNEPYDPLLWQSSIETSVTPLEESWQKALDAENALDYLEKNDKLAVAVGSSFSAPADSSDIQNKRAQCGTLIKETSWKMIFAENEEQFNQLWQDMKTELSGFGYDEVTEVDLENVELLRAARAQALKDAQ